MFVTLFEMDEVSFHLTGTKEFHEKPENERFTSAGLCCLQSLKFDNFTLSFDGLRQRNILKCVPHVQHDNFSPFNQSCA